jgi:hypothetical protein
MARLTEFHHQHGVGASVAAKLRNRVSASRPFRSRRWNAWHARSLAWCRCVMRAGFVGLATKPTQLKTQWDSNSAPGRSDRLARAVWPCGPWCVGKLRSGGHAVWSCARLASRLSMLAVDVCLSDGDSTNCPNCPWGFVSSFRVVGVV